jgi:hypothetical protein
MVRIRVRGRVILRMSKSGSSNLSHCSNTSEKWELGLGALNLSHCSNISDRRGNIDLTLTLTLTPIVT